MNHVSRSVISRLAAVAALVLATMLASCGGGASSVPTIQSQAPQSQPPFVVVPPAVNPATVLPFRVSIFIPDRYIAGATPPAATTRSIATVAGKRHPLYLPLTVGSINFNQTLSGGSVVNTNTLVVIGGFSCSASTGGQTCTASLVGALGSDSWVVTTYVSAAGTGSALSIATLAKTIINGQANTSALTLNPILSTMSFSPASASCNAGATCSPAVALAEYDVNAAQILGPGNFVNASNTATPITLTNSNGSMVLQNSSSTAAATSIAQVTDGTLAKFAYDGTQSPGTKTFTATATGVTTATFTFTLTTGTVSTNTPINVGNTNPTSANITATEAGLVGSFSQTPTGCAGIVTIGAVSGSGSPANFLVTQVGGGICTTVVSDGHGGSSTVTINSTTYVVTLSDVIRESQMIETLPTLEPGVTFV